jgi:hypothetical protein
MPQPDPATLAAGQNIGQNAATPLLFCARRQDLVAADWTTAVEHVVFGVVRSAGKVKKVSVIAAATPTADAGTSIAISIQRGGSPVSLWSGTLAAWAANTEVSLTTPGTATQQNDVFVMTFTKGASNIIPGLLFVVEQDIGL